jgi:hypothetical protein
MAEGTERERCVGSAYVRVTFGSPAAVIEFGHDFVTIQRDEAAEAAETLRLLADSLEAWSTPVLCDGVSTKEASL